VADSARLTPARQEKGAKDDWGEAPTLERVRAEEEKRGRAGRDTGRAPDRDIE